MMSDNFKVLLVDDESMVRMSISTFAKKAQIAIDTASNGLEAIQKIKDNTYTFVLMDLLMPEMDGKKATAEIKAIPGKENTKIVAMSADSVSDSELALYKFDYFVQKPINKVKFEEIISKYRAG